MSIRAWERETPKLGIQKLAICKLFCPLWLSASSFLKQEGAGVMLRPLTCPGYITGCVWESTEAMYVKSAVKMSRLLQKVQALLYIFWRSQLISASSPGTVFRSNHFRKKLDLGSWSKRMTPSMLCLRMTSHAFGQLLSITWFSSQHVRGSWNVHWAPGNTSWFWGD